MTQHTPGPWKFGKPSDAIISESCPKSCLHWEGDIECKEWYGGYVIAETVAPENKSLIIAAPDLLAAAEFALSVIRAQGLYDMSERMAADKLEAAIAKAHGTPPAAPEP